ncbi:hypothetical protein [Leifsonia sp. Leaf264]|uniref:hypothetical protein n=1 Tax=Leifsonia sp. Leaf264 TaxID=1736314 RepID=UPI0006FC4BA2|nr:hypothetical protein [Leifsonia sp. Leaf264]KQO98591.1 hypothetical protein ASF30_11050 [Leifsonia sp. Leaf264]
MTDHFLQQLAEKICTTRTGHVLLSYEPFAGDYAMARALMPMIEQAKQDAADAARASLFEYGSGMLSPEGTIWDEAPAWDVTDAQNQAARANLENADDPDANLCVPIRRIRASNWSQIPGIPADTDTTFPVVGEGLRAHWDALIPAGAAYELVRRDSLKPGDHAVSSHYGASIVRSVFFAGDNNQTTVIQWENNSTFHPFSERYDSASVIPLLTRAAVSA